MIDTIMLFAAGKGNRMRHLTQNKPKSLIPILQKPILYYALEMCKIYSFKKVVINTHYLSPEIEKAIEIFRQEQQGDFPEIITIYEEELLETGGAVKNAINILGTKPIFALNTDVVIKSEHNLFNEMQKFWHPDKMDFLLLMQPFEKAVGYCGLGDFEVDNTGRLTRPDIEGNYNYIYAGLQILKPEKIAKNPLKIFSLREYYLNSNKAFGMIARNTRWYHATKPEDLVDIEFDMLAHD
ncbi:MAG: NTP transferase domain-containing protein [Rickettsiaceae bacterium]|nr:NTP transferase domain-containing protein [Rickettsiaceae bacterium]